MNLFRLLVLVLLVVGVLRFLRRWQVRVEPRTPTPSRREGGDPEVLRACIRCGVMVPANSLNAAGICRRCAEGGR